MPKLIVSDNPGAFIAEPDRYQQARFQPVKIHVDYHFAISAHHYSVLDTLVRQSLETRLTRAGLALPQRGASVVSRARSKRCGVQSTWDAHMPAAHRVQTIWAPDRLIEWRQLIGVSIRNGRDSATGTVQAPGALQSLLP